MADLSTLHQKIAAVRPEAESKPSALMVGILKSDKIYSDQILVEDVQWIRCARNKNVARLLQAYKDAYPIPVDIDLMQNDRVLNEDDLIENLHAENGLVAIAAVNNRKNSIQNEPLHELTDAEINKQSASSPFSRARSTVSTPLSEITDQCIEFEASSSYSSIGDSHENDIPPTFNIYQDPLKIIAPQLPSPQSIPSSPAEDMTGWIDFAYEYQERLIRRSRCEQEPPRFSVPTTIISQWSNLDPSQRHFFAERARNTLHKSTLDHRAFWIYYFDRLDEKVRTGLNPEASSSHIMEFFEEVRDHWSHIQSTDRKEYIRRADRDLRCNPIPSLPKSLTDSIIPPTLSTPSDRIRQHIARTMSIETGSTNHDSTGQALLSSQTLSSSEMEPVEVTADRNFVRSSKREELAPAMLNLSSIFNDLSVEQLEIGLSKGIEIINLLRRKLGSEKSSDSNQWLQALANVEKQAETTKTIVGVVGMTGAGKSSAINAMLDEERLVPTNCMRACTAVVTEISYNYEQIPYRAVIEFITQDDWQKELKALFGDLVDGNGDVSRECTNEESEAGVAYAKLRAVYPLLTKEDMKTMGIEQLMKHDNVSMLGDSRSIEDNDSSAFYKKLQRYVDSKDKATTKEKKTEGDKAWVKEMEFWPLIRVVKLYVKAPALATGAVIVDLPGVHDSNQARAAVAQGYLKQCTRLWIVAPITRAVDDKSAKTLLGDSFKRQLKMDGSYNSVTFICSKTDDISLTEAQDSLGLDEEVAPLYARTEKLRDFKQDHDEQIRQLKEAKENINAAMDTADEEVEVWEKLQEDIESGETVYTPKQVSDQCSRKRKRGIAISRSTRKKSRCTEIDTGDDLTEDEESVNNDDENDDASENEDRGDPLTEDAISDKLAELKATKREARRERTKLEKSLKELRSKVHEIDSEQDEIDSQLSRKCIRGRNEYSRGAIQQDFASGIRELDQEIAEEGDAVNFNPDVEARDYDEVAKSLPVFCISSRGYQTLMGRFKKDQSLSSFGDIDETEIPALQKHCIGLTTINRKTSCQRFLNSLSQTLNSLRLWSLNDGSGANLTQGQMRQEAERLDEKLRELDMALAGAVQSVCSSIHDELQGNLYNVFPQAVTASQNQADSIQAKWGAPYNRLDRASGGLHYCTYRAVITRNGVYNGCSGRHHLNKDLLEPMMKHIASGWEKAFSRRIPQALFGLANTTDRILTEFHHKVEEHAMRNSTNISGIQVLRQQLPIYKESIKDISDAAKTHITMKQKDASREFVPIVTEAMLPAYEKTSAERGPGSFKRLKDAMARHVNDVRDTMFQNAANHVQKLLDSMFEETKDTVTNKLENVYMSIRRDYHSVMIGYESGLQSNQIMPQQQRMMRKQVMDIIDEVEMTMKKLVGLEVPESGTDHGLANDMRDESETSKGGGPNAKKNDEANPVVEQTLSPASRTGKLCYLLNEETV